MFSAELVAPTEELSFPVYQAAPCNKPRVATCWSNPNSVFDPVTGRSTVGLDGDVSLSGLPQHRSSVSAISRALPPIMPQLSLSRSVMFYKSSLSTQYALFTPPPSPAEAQWPDGTGKLNPTRHLYPVTMGGGPGSAVALVDDQTRSESHCSVTFERPEVRWPLEGYPFNKTPDLSPVIILHQYSNEGFVYFVFSGGPLTHFWSISGISFTVAGADRQARPAPWRGVGQSGPARAVI
ncbi:hypothetical protein J6590_043629 [Homalodisca vitripennis]|nr:hypothetical protein J6590_043629 [Homalodisca vitripennis]